MARYHQGRYRLQNPKKYCGDPHNVNFRSQWELQCMRKFDTNSNVLAWTSEEIVVNYRSPIDGRIHRYFPDFIIKKRGVDNSVSTIMIEVKPYHQTQKPILTEKKTRRRYISEFATYSINEAKWKAARKFCEERGWSFEILTEKELLKFK